MVDGRPEFEFETEVFPTKLDYESDYYSMLAEIEDLMSGLVLEYLRSTYSMGAQFVPPTPNRIGWLTLLEHVLEDLEQALRQVARSPQWGLIREARLTPVGRIRRLDEGVRRAVRTGKGAGQRQVLSSGVSVRAQIPETRSRPTLDTPEHQWIAAQLRRVSVTLGELVTVELARSARGRYAPSARAGATIDNLEAIQRRVSQLERLEPVAAATRLPAHGFGSMLLLTSPGYSEAYRCLMILQLGLRVAGGPLELSLKDLHLLYEYWTYLAVLRIASDESGCPIDPTDLLSAEQYGLQVRLRKGRQHDVRLKLADGRKLDVTYNPLFGGSNTLVPQRPDIVLTLRDDHWPRMRLLLDAKYRVDSSDQYRHQYQVAGPPQDAINVLHRYRDAILEELGEELLKSKQPARTVIQGAILFPGTADADTFVESPLFTSLERLGIGALPFLPGQQDLVRLWIRQAVRGDSWRMADRAYPQAAMVRRAANSRDASEWIAIAPPFVVPETQSLDNWRPGEIREFTISGVDPREPCLRGIAPVDRDLFGAAIRRVATVRSAGVRSDNGQLRMAVALEGWGELEGPIPSHSPVSGEAFPPPRIASALAVKRAKSFADLYLASVGEWRLVDALQAEGLRCRVAVPLAQVAEPPSEDAPRGRVCVGDQVIMYRSGAYEVLRPGHRIRIFASTDDVVRFVSNLSEYPDAQR